MAELKTKATPTNPRDFLATIEPEQKRADGLKLLEIFEKITGEKPVMWGGSIVGFGKYHYKSTKSAQEGDWFLVGFSPRKANLTLYITHGNEESATLLEKLGKHKANGGMSGCIYINKLADVDLKILEQLIDKSYHAERTYSA
ncbi:MAG TPA: DUF1801 domain-containing protein [Patescibacteria group bacterium]|nr:DUF1801 domain-containing protein [Patescibacteria group bacterium]